MFIQFDPRIFWIPLLSLLDRSCVRAEVEEKIYRLKRKDISIIKQTQIEYNGIKWILYLLRTFQLVCCTPLISNKYYGTVSIFPLNDHFISVFCLSAVGKKNLKKHKATILRSVIYISSSNVSGGLTRLQKEYVVLIIPPRRVQEATECYT